MTNTRYTISLRVTHPNIDSERISRELGLAADIQWNAGDTKRTPKGTELAGNRKESYWCHQFTDADPSLEHALAKITHALAEQRDFVAHLTETGGKLEYFIGWFSSGNSGFVLEPTLLRDLAERGIGLSFDIYAGD